MVALPVIATSPSQSRSGPRSMPFIRPQALALWRRAPRRNLHAGPSCRGGASSVLRLGLAFPSSFPMAHTMVRRVITSAEPTARSA